MPDSYKVIGLMSGTSLDGLDMAFCEFTHTDDKWVFNISAAATHEYTAEWRKKLSDTENKSAVELALLHSSFGHFTGKITRSFINEHNLAPNFIASHGHTIFHQPDKQLTFQIGNGAAIAAETELPVVCDFRTVDVALGGQGAPLVPIGDKLLFAAYGACINLGGFANISFNKQEDRIAFDICPLNIALNFLCKELDLLYDNEGSISRGGNINNELLTKLNQLEFYHTPYPKSLGKEWVVNYFIPLINSFNISVADKLRTVSEHAAIQIAVVIKNIPDYNTKLKVLVTGGGAFNIFLTERIIALADCTVIIPDVKTINYKEALVFAFLGVLRWEKQNNVLRSVTGASKNNTGGCIYWY